MTTAHTFCAIFTAVHVALRARLSRHPVVVLEGSCARGARCSELARSQLVESQSGSLLSVSKVGVKRKECVDRNRSVTRTRGCARKTESKCVSPDTCSYSYTYTHTHTQTSITRQHFTYANPDPSLNPVPPTHSIQHRPLHRSTLWFLLHARVFRDTVLSKMYF